jgi:hypothetical protein
MSRQSRKFIFRAADVVSQLQLESQPVRNIVPIASLVRSLLESQDCVIPVTEGQTIHLQPSVVSLSSWRVTFWGRRKHNGACHPSRTKN